VATVAHPTLEPAEFVALQAEAGWTLPVEFIGGEAIVIPPSGGHASSAQGELFYALRRWQQADRNRGLLLQDVFVTFPGGQYAAPDIAWWSAARRPALRDGAFDVIPDLVVEVLSPKTRGNDLGVKRELYLSSGVRELWLVDPPARTVTCVTPGRADQVFAAGDAVHSAQFAGFAITPNDVFGV
jgi:Uma2 family endonuclease